MTKEYNTDDLLGSTSVQSPSEKAQDKHIYYPALDSLRAIAIILVIISHWLPYYHVLNTLMPMGPFGVTLFFVLSGYLISGILLKEKREKDLHERSNWAIFKSFYLKRSIRIFPLYYLTLFVMLFMGLPNVMEFFGWHLSYTSNILFYLEKSWTNDYVAPLWSLSVEEQFYIIWPFAVLFSGRRFMLFWLVMGIVGGTAFRMLPENFTDKPFSYMQFLTPACMDSFAIGGVVAYIQHYYSDKLTDARKYFVIIAVVAFYVFIAISNDFVRIVLNRTIYASFASAYILLVITKKDISNRFFKCLEVKPLVFIGKISYSMYLWHSLIPEFKYWVSADLNFLMRLCFLLILSSASFYLLEKPLLSLKKYIK